MVLGDSSVGVSLVDLVHGFGDVDFVVTSESDSRDTI